MSSLLAKAERAASSARALLDLGDSDGACTRANVLLITTDMVIIGGIAFVVFGHVDGNSAVGDCIIAVVTLLAGKFATAFDFEFGRSADTEQTRKMLARAPRIGNK